MFCHRKLVRIYCLERKILEPSHEIMALFVLRKLILQMRMRNHPVGLDAWFLVGPFVYFHTSCVQTAKALARLRGCAGTPDPLLVAYVISTIISWAGSLILSKKNRYGVHLMIHVLGINSIFNHKNVCCRLSLELLQRDNSNEYSSNNLSLYTASPSTKYYSIMCRIKCCRK